jgi:uncharacterized membrane protein YdjX (TVP38/TMEM64 family)
MKKTALKIILGIVIVLGFLALFIFTDAESRMLDLVAWIQGQGIKGAIVFALIYVVACVFVAPGTPLSMAGGYIYGPFWGTVVVVISATGGAAASFLVGRYVARDFVERLIGKDPRFVAVDKAVGRRGRNLVLLSRFSPFPFNPLNYSWGLTGVKFRDYLPATFVGLIPFSFTLVYAGSLLTKLTQIGASGIDMPGKGIAIAVGFAVALIFLGVISRVAMRAWKEAMADVPE